MDELSQRLFGVPATVVNAPSEQTLTHVTRMVFGRSLSPGDLARIVAAPSGSRVSVEVEGAVRVEVRHDALDLTLDRIFRRDLGGKAYAFHEFTEISAAPKGTGSRIFCREVDEYVRLGLVRIRNVGADHPGGRIFNGYYTWPRLGFNMALDAPTVRIAAVEGFDVNDLNGLMLYGEAAAAWWKEHGYEGEMTFDLAEGSMSRIILDEYRKSRRIKV